MLQELGLYDESSFLPVGLVFQIITQLSHLGIKPGAKVELLPLSLISILSPRLVHVSTRFPLPSRTVFPANDTRVISRHKMAEKMAVLI
ncbi:MAG: hypothetical protein ACLQO6_11690 [Desulfomonilaceae bacterium]